MKTKKIIHIAPFGNDITGDGSLKNPYRSITKVLSMNSVDKFTIKMSSLNPGGRKAL